MSSSKQISMSLEELRAVVDEGKYNLVPLFRNITADLETPVSVFLKLQQQNTHSFLLESIEGGANQARYSFIGTNPYTVIEQNGVDPLVKIEKELAEFKEMPVAGLPTFTGGGVGYVSYDCVRHWEPTVDIADKDTLGLPESVFMFSRSVVAFDHVQHTIKLVVHADLRAVFAADTAEKKAKELEHAHAAAIAEIDRLSHLLNKPLAAHHHYAVSASASAATDKAPEMKSDVGQTGYEKFVTTLKEHIVKGDIIQAVPSQRLSYPLKEAKAFDVYRQLRVVNPSPYMFYLDLGSFQIVGASPEQLIKVESNGKVTTHPIAGTRRRGVTPEEDEALAKELLANEKERAEHVMLVDLGRNDIGRVAASGSVKVDSLMHIERYSHVMHIVSHVSGQLDASKTMYDAFRSVFPAGTLSGAPKVRAMQLVAGLEQKRRGVYGGAVGYISFNNVMDTAIAIRTLVVKDGVAYLQAGGGIVHDSQPTAEYEETMNKMLALSRAITQAEHAVAASNVETKIREKEDAVRDTVMKNYYGPVSSLPSTFGKFGGRYVPETLVGALEDLEREYIKALNDPSFKEELRQLQKTYVGRPTSLYYSESLTKKCGGARVWLKREDLAHTGAHKINNGLGQGLLAKRMGKKRIIAETGAGQHGVATATACALLDLDCTVYMGEEDIGRQALNVFRMKMLGAKVVPVMSGTRTLKDAVNEAMRDWVTNVRDTFFLIGSAIGPHPFPTIVRDFQCCLGEEARAQMLEQAGKLPDAVVACVGGGSNAIGIFHPFVEDKSVKLFGVEAAGHGLDSGKHSATLVGGKTGVLHGTRTFLLQDENGQIQPTHSISAGLDYPGVGPEHAHLKDTGRVEYVGVTDKQALQGLQDMTRLTGIIPALEPSHAIYFAMKLAAKMPKDQDLLLNLCGRGDKDMIQVAEALNVKLKS